MNTYTTFIKQSNKTGFSENFTVKSLFQFLNDWFGNYLTNPDYDWITSKGGYLPSLTWAKLNPGATSRSEPNIQSLHPYFVLDYDECLLDPAAFVNELARSGLHCFFHETTGSQKEKDELQQTIYKYHVFIETDFKIPKGVFINHGKEILAKVGSRVGIAGYDETCHDAPRIMFLPVRSLLRKDEQGGYIPLAYGELQGAELDILAIMDDVKQQETEKQADSVPNEAPTSQETNNWHATPKNYTSGRGGFKMRDCTPEVKEAVVKSLLSGVPFTDNTQWVSVAFAIYDALGDSGKQQWEHWCKHTISYDPAKHDTQIQSAWKSATKTASYDNNIAPLMAVCTDMGKKSQAAAMIYYNDVNATKKTQSPPPSTHDDTMSLDNTPDIDNMIAWGSKLVHTHKSVALETEQGLATGIPAIDNRIGVWARTQKGDKVKGVDTLGVLPTTSAVLVGAATGVGKTTAMCNLILAYANKNNNPLGEAKNVIVFSLEGGASMYTQTLLKIAHRRQFADIRLKNKLNEFFKLHGRSVLYTNNKTDKDFFNNEDTVINYPNKGFKNDYNTDCMRELTDLLIASDPNLGNITIMNSFQSMHPEEIMNQVDIIEKAYKTKYDVICVDYVQALLFDEKKGVSEVQGLRNSTKTLIDWCNAEQRIPLFATQMVNYNPLEHDKPLELKDVAQAKNISYFFSHILLLQQAIYDRDYWKRTDLPNKDEICDSEHKRIGVLRCNIVKSRTGGKTRTNTDCLIGICQDTLAFTPDVIDPELVKQSDKEHKANRNTGRNTSTNNTETDNRQGGWDERG